MGASFHHRFPSMDDIEALLSWYIGALLELLVGQDGTCRNSVFLVHRHLAVMLIAQMGRVEAPPSWYTGTLL